MKLYEVNQALEALLEQLMPDPETGEVLVDDDSIFEEINSLEMAKSSILEYLAKIVIDTKSDIAGLKAEEKRLHDRRKTFENKVDRIMNILDRECGGVKTDCGVATVCYRKSTKVEVTDNDKAVDYLVSNAMDNCYKVAQPTIDKTEVKKVLSAGVEIPGIELVQGLSCSLK